MLDEVPSTGSFDRIHLLQLIGRAILLVIAAGVILILGASAASALDVPDATGVVGGVTDTVAGTATGTVGNTTDTVANTTDTVANTTDTVVGTATDTVANTTDTVVGTATDTVADTTETVADTTDAVTDTAGNVVAQTTDVVADTSDAASGIVDRAATGATQTTELVGRATRDLVGPAGGVIEDGVGLVDGIADTAVDGVSTTLDPVTNTIDGVVSGLDDWVSGGVVPIPDVTAPDPIIVPTGSPPETGSPHTPTGSREHPSSILRGPVSGSAANMSTGVHLVPTDAPRPVPGGAVPGRPSNGGLPSPLDVAAAMMRGLSEAGGPSLVLWALVALVGFLPVMDDRWLRFVRPALPRAPHVAQDGRPG
jgi:hypothetical protein